MALKRSVSTFTKKSQIRAFLTKIFVVLSTRCLHNTQKNQGESHHTMSCNSCGWSKGIAVCKRPGDNKTVVMHLCGVCGTMNQYVVEPVNYIEQVKKFCKLQREIREDDSGDLLFCDICYTYVNMTDLPTHYPCEGRK